MRPGGWTDFATSPIHKIDLNVAIEIDLMQARLNESPWRLAANLSIET
jgi:hypothetical protein